MLYLEWRSCVWFPGRSRFFYLESLILFRIFSCSDSNEIISSVLMLIFHGEFHTSSQIERIDPFVMWSLIKPYYTSIVSVLFLG